MNTVLLIEDNVDNSMLLEDIFLLDDISARLVNVATGEEGLNRAIELRPTVILMDLRLPGIDGLEATQILKGDPRTRDIPVWAITAYCMPGDEEKARVAGCCEYFVKPLLVRGFGHCLRSFLQGVNAAKSEEQASVQSADC